MAADTASPRFLASTTPRRALLVGATAGLLFGLAATQGVGAAVDAAHPGAETAPGKHTESGAVPHTGLPTGLAVTGAPARRSDPA